MNFTRTIYDVDAFIAKVNEMGEFENYDEFVKWVNFGVYFKYYVYTNSQGHKLFRVFDEVNQKIKFVGFMNNDVLFYTLGSNGKRISAKDVPMFMDSNNFFARFS